MTPNRLEVENKALTIALHIAVTALRLNATCADQSPEAWPEVATDDQVLRRVWSALFPLLGYAKGIEMAVEMLSPSTVDPEMLDQESLLLRWSNLQMTANLAASGLLTVRS